MVLSLWSWQLLSTSWLHFLPCGAAPARTDLLWSLSCLLVSRGKTDPSLKGQKVMGTIFLLLMANGIITQGEFRHNLNVPTWITTLDLPRIRILHVLSSISFFVLSSIYTLSPLISLSVVKRNCNTTAKVYVFPRKLKSSSQRSPPSHWMFHHNTAQ